MDKTLQSDIEKHFFPEYSKRNREQRTGFFKAFDKFTDAIDRGIKRATFNTVEPAGVLLLGVVLAFAGGVPLGFAALGLLVTDLVVSIASSASNRATVEEQIKKDIDNGSLPERYSAVIDHRIKGLETQIEDYRSQRSQLPEKGAATAAFVAATTEAAAAAAPAAAPVSQPSGPANK